MLTEFSDALQALVRDWRGRLVHIGGRGIAGRTGVMVGDDLVASLAMEARDGEELTVIGPDGQEKPATVKAWDRRSGLVLLEAPGLGTAGQLEAAASPVVGQLALTVAFPSAHGVEASLAMVRYVGGATRMGRLAVEGHFQTDGQAFPGFGGSPVLDVHGKLMGLLVENAPGNQGWILPAAEWLGMVASLFANGSWQKPWMGVSLMPVQLETAQVEKAGQAKALVVNSVVADSPASQAGLRPGDLILTVGGQAVGEATTETAEDCDCAGDDCGCHTPHGHHGHHRGRHRHHHHAQSFKLPELTVGQPTTLIVLRGDQRLELTVTPRRAED